MNITDKEIIAAIQLARSCGGDHDTVIQLVTLLEKVLQYHRTMEVYISEREWIHREG